jgi:phosphoribosylformylglycinamidine cyclo-ligase
MDYTSSGVNIDAGNEAVDRIKPLVAKTFSPQVLTGLGQFGSFFELPSGYHQPVLVSSTDGVGTKLKVAIEANQFDTIGIDLVAMCVNDLICSGAKPLYFLDYIAVHALDPQRIETIISGMVSGCSQANMALVGGEMAEMNDMYRPGDFDVAGFCVGVVEKSGIIDGSAIREGDTIYALPSSGIHSNGYSLVRRIFSTESTRQNWRVSVQELLTPTTIYVSAVETLLKNYAVHGIAHITGGGLVENIERIVPQGLGVVIDWASVNTPSIFNTIQKAGTVSDDTMRRVFNMGVGLAIITADDMSDYPDAYPIGRISRD